MNLSNLSAPSYEYSPQGYLRADIMPEQPRIADDASVSRHLQQFEIELVRQLIPRMKVVVDIGAGSGPFCLMAARAVDPAGTVVAYETRPECLADLRQAVYLNNWENRLDVRPIAIAGRPSRFQLYSSPSGADRGGGLDGDGSVPSGAMGVDSLDHQVEQMHLDRLDLLRINPQHSELNVLRGAEAVIAKYSPVLVIGITDSLHEPHRTNKDDLPAMRWLQAHGYAVYAWTKDIRLIKVSLSLPTKTSGTYFCFKMGMQKNWEIQLRTWTFKHRIWRFFRHSRADELTPAPPRRPNRLEKALRNPSAAIAAIIARVGLIYPHPAGRGRR